jgi:glucosamine-6-phosphate deaminase
MRVSPTVFSTPSEAGEVLASLIADEIENGDQAQPFVLGCPSGRSPLSTYIALAEEVRRRRLDLTRVILVMMDEYVESVEGVLKRIDERSAHSCALFAREDIVRRLNAAAGRGRGIADEHLWFPEPDDGAEFDARIKALGGVDLFILASGSSDGHVAFNPRGTAASAQTRVVELSEETRTDNLHTFPSFHEDLSRVPTLGVTVGVATIRDLSKRVVMLALGEDKAEAVRRVSLADGYDPDWPATIVSECHDPLFFVDEAAMAKQATDAETTERADDAWSRR